MTSRLTRIGGTFLLAVALGLGVIVVRGAGAAEAPVGLGTAGSFAVLAGSEVTNTGRSVISGDLGVSPGTAITGFPPGVVNSGAQHSADAEAAQAQADLTTAYDDAAGRSPTTTVTADLGGQRLVPGVYRGSTLELTGTVTLDAVGDPSAVFIFQAGTSLITATDSAVALVNGANGCNVFWQIGSSATLGTRTAFKGTLMALTSITADTDAAVEPGRLLARNGAVTLDTNNVTGSTCATAAPATTTTTAPATTTTTTEPAATTTTTTTTEPAETGAVTTTTTNPAAGSNTTSSDQASPPVTTRGGASSTGSGTTTNDDGSSTSERPRTTTPVARTGQHVSDMVLAGLLAIGLGTGMLLASRRPAPATPLRTDPRPR